MQIEWKGSPNFWKDRKLGGVQHKIKHVVIHWFGTGTLESANTRFQNPANQTSAHYGISKGRVWQWVKEQDASWNSGNQTMNLECIGIEHDATLNGHDLAEQDYQHSGELVAAICKRYNLPIDRKTIIGHREVKPTQCPGTVNIDKIIAIAKSLSDTKPMLEIVNDNGTYFLVGEKGKLGITDGKGLDFYRKLTDKERTGSTAGIPSVGTFGETLGVDLD